MSVLLLTMLLVLGCGGQSPEAGKASPSVASPSVSGGVIEADATPLPVSPPAPTVPTPRPVDTATPVVPATAALPTLIPPPGATPSGEGTVPSPIGTLATGTSPAATPNRSSSPVPELAVAPSATPAPERLRVATASQGANLRREPGLGGTLLGTLRNGVEVSVVGADRVVDGQAWRNVRSPEGEEGWIVDAAVETIATAVPTRAAPSSPALPASGTAGTLGATGTPGATETPSLTSATNPGGTVTPALLVADTPPASGSVTPTERPILGETPTVPTVATATAVPSAPPPPTATPERVRVSDAQGANLRAEPGSGGQLVKPLRLGAELTVVGSNREVEGRVWRNVRDATGETGWAVGEALTSLSPPATPTPLATTPAPSGGAPSEPTSGPATAAEPSSLADSPAGPTATPTDPAGPCRAGQVKGDAASGLYYLPGHPDYPEIRGRVRCFDEESRARASGFLPAP